jgi:propionyl-CoA synthetase
MSFLNLSLQNGGASGLNRRSIEDRNEFWAEQAGILSDPAGTKALEQEIIHDVTHALGAVAKPSRVLFLPALPKTRSGKLLRRAVQAILEGCDTGDLTTLEDSTVLPRLKHALPS